MTGSFHNLKISILLLLIAGYLVFSYSFMQLRIPPTGVGAPLGELALASILFTVNVPKVLSRIGTVMPLPLLLFWWSWGFARLIVDAIGEGLWAFRDATQLIETLYIVVGFALFVGPEQTSRLSRWLRGIIIVSCLYGLLFVVGNTLAAISPTLSGGSGQAIPILGTFATSGTMLLLGAFYCMTLPRGSGFSSLWPTLTAGFLVSYAIVVMQTRTIYLQLLCLAALMLVFRPSALRRLGFAIPVLCFAVTIATVFEIRVAGRLSSEISWSFLWDHVQSIFGVGSKGGVGEAAAGVPLRLGWWLRLYQELTSDPVALVSGLGFGIALTDFRDTLGTLAREPHNSVISVFGRLGVVGGICWLWIQIALFRVGYHAYHACARLRRSEESRLVLLTMALAVLILAGCLGEDIMEKPYHAVPYYALWGVVLRIAYNVRKAPPLPPAYADQMPVRGSP